MLGRIRERFGDSHKFIGEEGSAAQGFTSELTDEPTWICDPLDGACLAAYAALLLPNSLGPFSLLTRRSAHRDNQLCAPVPLRVHLHRLCSQQAGSGKRQGGKSEGVEERERGDRGQCECDVR